MRSIVDGAIMLLFSAIAWFVTYIFVAIAARSLFQPDAAVPLAMAVATVIAASILFLWAAGRRASTQNENRNNADENIIIEYGALFDELSATKFIYDESKLPFPKATILQALLRRAKSGKDDLITTAAVELAPTLAHFQQGVGSEPVLTQAGLVQNLNGMSVEKTAAAHSTFRKSRFEEIAEKEKTAILRQMSQATTGNS